MTTNWTAMTQTLETLSHRIVTLQNIRGVVRTMKALSAVNAMPYDRAAASIESYHASILDGLQLFTNTTHMIETLTFDPDAPKIILAFGSDHGLCGGYNEILANAALELIGSDNWQIFTVGARMANALSGLGVTLANQFTPPASVDGIGRLAGEILVDLDQYRSQTKKGEIEVKMIHMMSGSHGTQSITVRTLLPLGHRFLMDLADRPRKSRSLPTITMAPKAVFAALIRNHLFASLFRATAVAMAAENGARLTLMQQAEKAIDDRYEEMLQVVRSTRQTEITNELLDIIVGFEALKKKKIDN
jgi:F-type H+-transporting ATPase subunit gamma